jgi:fibronectin-binding autotransporter adhesin
MNTSKQYLASASLLAGLAYLAASSTTSLAGDVVKADNLTNLDQGASWVGGVAPTASDVAVWDSTVTVANTALLGIDTNWAGIRVADPGGLATVAPYVSAAAVTAVGGSPTLTYVAAPANPLVTGSRAVLSGTVAPTNFTFGVAYYVVNATATTFQLSATSGGAAIVPTGPGSAPAVTGHVLALGASGIDMSLATNSLTLGCPVALTANQTWNVTNGRTLTVSGGVSGAASITKTGDGVLVVGGAGSYSGGTVNSGGILQINSGTGIGAAAGGLTNNNGSTVRIRTSTSIANPPNWNGTVTVDLDNFANNAALTGSWSGDGTVNIIKQDGTAVRTFTMGGSSANWNGFTGTVNVGTNTGFFRFNDGGGSVNTGNSQATMNLGTATASFLTRNRNAPVNFGVLLGVPGTRVINGSSSSGTSTYSLGGKNVPFTFEGAFVDASATAALAINKVGTSTMTLTGTNSYRGTTTVTAGTLQVGNGGTLGNLGSGAIVNNAALVYNRSDAITVSNAISGSGNLTLQGGNVVTFEGANTSSGTLVVSAGAAEVGSGGSIQCPVSLASGTFLIVTNNPLFVLAQPLSGVGTVDGVLTAAAATFRPAGAGAGGTLSFNTNLVETGGAVHELELATSGPTDLISVAGDLNVSGVNSVVVSKLGGGTLDVGFYPLISYGGMFNGTLANFTVSAVGVTATLTNPPGQIAVIIAPPERGATNLTWVGDGGANYWDDNLSTNWVNGVSQFTFKAGDTVRFDAAGAANPTVNLNSAILVPAAVVVDAANDYTLTGIGSINGSTGLTKNNSGTLFVQTINAFSGPTVVNGGTLDIATVANGNAPSSIGAASSNPTNLVVNGATLRYSSATSGGTDRGATLNGAEGIIDVSTANLTFNGSPITGPAALVKSGAGTLTLSVPNTYSGGTVLSNGVLALGDNIANNNGTGGSALGATTDPVTFRGGTLQLFGYTGSEAANYSTVYNPLIVPAGETGELRMFQRGPVNSGAAAGLQSSLTGEGTLNLVVNYVRDDLSGDWSAFTGLINVLPRDTGDEMRVNNNYGYSNATINLNDYVSLCRSFTANTVNDIGALTGTSLAVLGNGSSSGVNTTWRIGWLNTSDTFGGTIADGTGTTVIKVGTGTWTLSGTVQATNTVVSNGVVALTGSFAGANLQVVSGAALDVSLAGTLFLSTGSTLGGNGTVWGSVDTIFGGNVAPGFSIDTLTITNAANLVGTVTAEVDRNGGTELADKITCPTITLGGTLKIVNLGQPFEIGDTFDLFDGAVSGAFTTINGGYYTWDTSQVTVNGTISVTGMLPPPSLTSSFDGATLTLSAAGGIPGGSLSIVTSTDVSAPLDTWTVLQADVFDPSGNYFYYTAVNFGEEKRFYAVRAQ